MIKARMLGRVVGTPPIFCERDGEVLDDPESFKTKERIQAQRA